MLVAYDAQGRIGATLDYMVQYADDGTPLGLVDFGAHEDAGGEHTDIWQVEGAAGSKVWPEWIGSRAHDFDVELVGPPGRKRIAALVHRLSGHRREHGVLDAEISRRVAAAGNFPADIRDLVGGPDRPLLVDDQGRTAIRPVPAASRLPLLRI